MRTDVKSGQTPNNSTGTTKATRTRRFPVFFRDFVSLEITPVPETYLVQFTATGKMGYTINDPLLTIDVSREVRAVHPYMALGAVLSDLDRRYSNLCIRFSTVVIRKA